MTFKEPQVEAEHPPIHIKKKRIAWVNAGHLEKLAMVYPEVVEKETVWKTPALIDEPRVG